MKSLLALSLCAALFAVGCGKKGDSAKLGGKSAAEWAEKLDDPKPSVRRDALGVLYRMCDEGNDLEAAEHLALGLQDKDNDNRMTAIMFLGKLGPKAEVALEELKKAVDDPNPAIASEAAKAVELIGAKPAAAAPEAK